MMLMPSLPCGMNNVSWPKGVTVLCVQCGLECGSMEMSFSELDQKTLKVEVQYVSETGQYVSETGQFGSEF